MSNRTGLYAALAAAGVGGYYLYRAGGDPKAAKQEIKHDADVARNKVPADKAEKAGQKVGSEAGAHIDEAVSNARTQAQDASNRASGLAHESLDKLNDVRQDASATIKANVDKFDKTVEQKTSEAKGSLSSWWSGSK
ncbi:hypothetical protein BDV38DRAFT_284024 [Aspergillus pseudotamarii]|uniref:Calcofluor white hypersensitive protein n=1 Tax=Aspergillus pseudotamarii TaxID=132259 RepID=A0A5N6SR81_ASPPS|nr:uncharacterized protein BDV38DRAFT_284024 [Aspergillus pseudotamarii]KAE8136270.1 hypothetical protein BDV38DRAFT_284024 [Aspergillus pseudotamarii]